MLARNTSSSAPTSKGWTLTPKSPKPTRIANAVRSVVISTPPSAMPVRIAMREHGAMK